MTLMARTQRARVPLSAQFELDWSCIHRGGAVSVGAHVHSQLSIHLPGGRRWAWESMDLCHRTARNEGSTGPKRLDDTRCTTYNISATNKLQDGGTHFVTLLTITSSSSSNSIMRPHLLSATTPPGGPRAPAPPGAGPTERSASTPSRLIRFLRSAPSKRHNHGALCTG